MDLQVVLKMPVRKKVKRKMATAGSRELSLLSSQDTESKWAQFQEGLVTNLLAFVVLLSFYQRTLITGF